MNFHHEESPPHENKVPSYLSQMEARLWRLLFKDPKPRKKIGLLTSVTETTITITFGQKIRDTFSGDFSVRFWSEEYDRATWDLIKRSTK